MAYAMPKARECGRTRKCMQSMRHMQLTGGRSCDAHSCLRCSTAVDGGADVQRGPLQAGHAVRADPGAATEPWILAAVQPRSLSPRVNTRPACRRRDHDVACTHLASVQAAFTLSVADQAYFIRHAIFDSR